MKMELSPSMETASWDVFAEMSEHEQVVFCNDRASGLRAIIAIHNTTLGPALGGCRMYPYPSTEAALDDVLRLSRGMTKKCAAVDVDFGGGKAVIIGDPKKDKSPDLFRAFGQFVESLQGRFYTGTDMGTALDDFVHCLKETHCIAGKPKEYGGNGDTSIPTAAGVLNSLRAVNQFMYGDDTLAGYTYAIQGLGKVGLKVAYQLLEAGCDLYVSDPEEAAITEVKAYSQALGRTVHVAYGDDIYTADADVFVPCARGGILNDDSIAKLKVRAVVGAANNQLEKEHHSVMLDQRGIIYAPDYIVNSGGLIQVADELYGGNADRVMMKVADIYHSLLEVLQTAKSEKVTTHVAADRICERRLQERMSRNSFFSPRVRPKWNF
ncbi:Leu/Phe/Val dehydrogenase [Shouchella lonarensis]|nr:Glu/Leu/Phe/Val dehydrogenase [Shouchella lonarensis]